MTDSDLQLHIEKLGKLLILNNCTLVTAESCTGGGIAYALTAVPGSSQWFERGMVSYSNIAKEELLSVSAEILSRCGAVSEETAAAMAVGALLHSAADISVSVTGIAGPDGGTAEKPVGTVCFGWGRRGGETKTASYVFDGNRDAIRRKAILRGIQGLLDIVEEPDFGIERQG